MNTLITFLVTLFIFISALLLCSYWSKIINTIFFPIRLFVSHKGLNKMGLRSMQDERYDITKKHCKGKLLDIGCGNNKLVKSYGNGIGVDVYDFGVDSLIVKDSAKIPFKDKSFDTISFVSCLNHIPKRVDTLKEAHRLLKDDGRLLITMIDPLTGYIRHKLDYFASDQHERGFKEGEEMGLSNKCVISIMKEAGFSLVKRKRFVILNNLYIFRKYIH